MAASSEEFICSHCHRVSNEMACSSCGTPCRKRKGTLLAQNALRWPSSSTSQALKSKVPKQLISLVKKCPQWEQQIIALAENNKHYAHFSCKEMEQEITGRSILRGTWKMLQENANQLIASIKHRSNKLEVTTSCPLSEQNSFDLSVENKASNFNNLADKFLFGGEIYIRLRATKSTTKGLLEWKEKANRLHDVTLHEELVGYLTT